VNGELAQVIALASHGSVWLAGVGEDALLGLERESSTFRHVRRVRFELGSAVAGDVATWLQGVRDRGVQRLWLVIPDPGAVTVGGLAVGERMLVAFASAGRWLLVGTTASRPSELWRPTWTVGDRNDPERRIWDVDYAGDRGDGAPAPLTPDVSASSERLRLALQRAEEFARTHDLGMWAEEFRGALRRGDSDHPEPPYYADMLPGRGVGTPARRLVATAAAAWVFGGMGSWNDLSFEAPGDAGDYDRLSDELYAAVLEAFAAGVNADLVV
jgi:hypothetical protein